MKVQTKKEPVEFKPVTVTITFETQEELNVFTTMCEMNVTVPNALSSYLNSDQRPRLTYVLNCIYNSI